MKKTRSVSIAGLLSLLVLALSACSLIPSGPPTPPTESRLKVFAEEVLSNAQSQVEAAVSQNVKSLTGLEASQVTFSTSKIEGVGWFPRIEPTSATCEFVQGFSTSDPTDDLSKIVCPIVFRNEGTCTHEQGLKIKDGKYLIPPDPNYLTKFNSYSLTCKRSTTNKDVIPSRERVTASVEQIARALETLTCGTHDFGIYKIQQISSNHYWIVSDLMVDLIPGNPDGGQGRASFGIYTDSERDEYTIEEDGLGWADGFNCYSDEPTKYTGAAVNLQINAGN